MWRKGKFAAGNLKNKWRVEQTTDKSTQSEELA